MADTTHADQRAELARQQAVIDAVAARNERLAAGEDPDQSGVSGPSETAKPEAEPEKSSGKRK